MIQMGVQQIGSPTIWTASSRGGVMISVRPLFGTCRKRRSKDCDQKGRGLAVPVWDGRPRRGVGG